MVLSRMSAKGNCYDNAAMESFWAILKAELEITKLFRTNEEAGLAIFDYIEACYTGAEFTVLSVICRRLTMN